jgi:hypothetical protein
MMLLVVPIAAWSKRDTSITWAALWAAVKRPLLSGLVASAVGLIAKIMFDGMLPPIPYLLVAGTLVLGVYGWVLLIAMGQKDLYVDLLNQVYPSSMRGWLPTRGGQPK